MGMRLPAELEWLEWVVGSEWPEADEDALWRLAEAWQTAATEVKAILEAGDAAHRQAAAWIDGAAGDRFTAHWLTFTGGDTEHLVRLVETCQQLAATCDGTALEVEYAKYQFIIALIMLAIQVTYMLAMAAATFGASTAGIPVATAATQLTVRVIAQKLIEAILTAVAQNVLADVAVQVIQMAKGHRTGLDLDRTASAAIDGAVAGAVGGAIGLGSARLSPGVAETLLESVAKGAVSNVSTAVISAALHGEELSLDDLARAATSGAVGGAVEHGTAVAEARADGGLPPGTGPDAGADPNTDPNADPNTGPLGGSGTGGDGTPADHGTDPTHPDTTTETGSGTDPMTGDPTKPDGADRSATGAASAEPAGTGDRQPPTATTRTEQPAVSGSADRFQTALSPDTGSRPAADPTPVRTSTTHTAGHATSAGSDTPRQESAPARVASPVPSASLASAGADQLVGAGRTPQVGHSPTIGQIPGGTALIGDRLAPSGGPSGLGMLPADQLATTHTGPGGGSGGVPTGTSGGTAPGGTAPGGTAPGPGSPGTGSGGPAGTARAGGAAATPEDRRGPLDERRGYGPDERRGLDERRTGLARHYQAARPHDEDDAPEPTERETGTPKPVVVVTYPVEPAQPVAAHPVRHLPAGDPAGDAPSRAARHRPVLLGDGQTYRPRFDVASPPVPAQAQPGLGDGPADGLAGPGLIRPEPEFPDSELASLRATPSDRLTEAQRRAVAELRLRISLTAGDVLTLVGGSGTPDRPAVEAVTR